MHKYFLTMLNKENLLNIVQWENGMLILTLPLKFTNIYNFNSIINIINVTIDNITIEKNNIVKTLGDSFTFKGTLQHTTIDKETNKYILFYSLPKIKEYLLDLKVVDFDLQVTIDLTNENNTQDLKLSNKCNIKIVENDIYNSLKTLSMIRKIIRS